jgi:hypothetical protein
MFSNVPLRRSLACGLLLLLSKVQQMYYVEPGKQQRPLDAS